MTKTEDGLVVSCDACGSRYRMPRSAVGPEGCKVRCPSCQGTLVVFPGPGGRVPIDLEPPTADVPLTPVTARPAPPRSPDPTDAPDPWDTAALSVTPPPPRRFQNGGGGAFSTTPVSTPRLPHPDAIPIRMTPPPRTATAAPTRSRSARPPVARTDAPPIRRRHQALGQTLHTAPTEPVPTPRRHTPLPDSSPPPRAVTEPTAPGRGFAVRTHPGAANRTGSTGASLPSRATPVPGAPPLSYAPPWSQTPFGPPGPWTHPGVTATPVGWVPTGTPAPVHAPWSDPRSAPTPVVALDRATVFGFLALSVVIGVLCFIVGLSWDRLSAPPPTAGPILEARSADGPAVRVLSPAPRWRTEPRLPRLEARPAARPEVREPSPPVAPAVVSPPRPTFSVEASDVRDPWADE